MLPDLAPTGRRVEVPVGSPLSNSGRVSWRTSTFTWDQASVLVQLGLIEASTLPVAGIESARKALDPELAVERSNGSRQPKQVSIQPTMERIDAKTAV